MVDNVTTPVGRLVQGDCYKANAQTDVRTKQPKLDAQGKPVETTFVAIAFPKTDPAWQAFKRDHLRAPARAVWPQYHDAAGNCTNPTFADKITDGDGRDQKGVPHSDKTGFAGHDVLKLTRNATIGLPRVVEMVDGVGWTDTEKGKVKLGDYVRARLNTSSNNSKESPGMYVNLEMIAFEREGDRIFLGESADQAFGATSATASPPPAAPPPVSSGPIMLPAANGVAYGAYKTAGWTDEALISAGYMQAPAAPPPAPAAPAPAAPPPAPAAPPPAPAAPPPAPHIIMPPPAPPTPSAPPTPVMTASATGSYAQYKTAGWTDAQLITAGLMLDTIPV